jgi:hypothetical protein
MRLFCKKNYVLLLCLLLQNFAVLAFAARAMTQQQWDKLTSDKAFGYKNEVENIQPPQTFAPNGFEKALRAFFGFFGSGIGNILIWLILASVVIYVVYRLFFSSDSFLFGKSSKLMKGPGAAEDDAEDIAATNWDALLQAALAKNDLRLAVRYSYMWLLQLLQQRELIQYRIDKTNYEYADELHETSYKQAFRQLSRQYEYAWYGGINISGEKYAEYTTLFDQTRKQLAQ